MAGYSNLRGPRFEGPPFPELLNRVNHIVLALFCVQQCEVAPAVQAKSRADCSDCPSGILCSPKITFSTVYLAKIPNNCPSVQNPQVSSLYAGTRNGSWACGDSVFDAKLCLGENCDLEFNSWKLTPCIADDGQYSTYHFFRFFPSVQLTVLLNNRTYANSVYK
jgi:hypothetical protein